MKKVLILLLFVFLQCYNPPELKKGGMYSMLDSGGYIVAQLVDFENDIVYVLYHENLFKNRPKESELVDLKIMYSEKDKNSEKIPNFFPFKKEDFYSWKPKFIAERQIDPALTKMVLFFKINKIIIPNNRNENIKNSKEEK
jgi:hypothetical protein